MRSTHMRIPAIDVMPGDRVIEPQGAYVSATVERTVCSLEKVFIRTNKFDLQLAPTAMISVWRFFSREQSK